MAKRIEDYGLIGDCRRSACQPCRLGRLVVVAAFRFWVRFCGPWGHRRQWTLDHRPNRSRASHPPPLSRQHTGSGNLTAAEAATLAAMSSVKILVLTHISGRYPDEEILAEATKIFPNSRVAIDFDRIPS